MKTSRIKLIIIVLIIVGIIFVVATLFKVEDDRKTSNISNQYPLLDINDSTSSFIEVVVIPNNIIEDFISPPWIINIVQSAGYSRFTGETIAEFSVTSGGKFEWRKTTTDSLSIDADFLEYKIIKGVIPKSEIKNFIAQLEQFQPGLLMEDAEIIKLVWRDASGQTKMLTSSYLRQSDPPISNLINTIEELVQKYGKLK